MSKPMLDDHRPILTRTDYLQWRMEQETQPAPFWFILSVLVLVLVTLGAYFSIVALLGR